MDGACTGAGDGLGGRGVRSDGGGVSDRQRSCSTPTPLSNSTSQRILAAFLVSFVGGGEGASKDSGGEGSVGGGSGRGGSGPVGEGAAWAGRKGAQGNGCAAALAA
jgi:hypothetical protein